MVWQVEVPGTQTVTLVNTPLAELPVGPELTDSTATFWPGGVMTWGGLLLPPPQARASPMPEMETRAPATRRNEQLLDDISRYPLGQHFRYVGFSEKGAHVSAGVDHESGLLDHQWPGTVAMGLCRVGKLLEVGAEELLEVRAKGALPGDAEYFSFGGNKLAHHVASGVAEFVHVITLVLGGAQGCLQAYLIVGDRGGVAPERREGGQGEQPESHGESDHRKTSEIEHGFLNHDFLDGFEQGRFSCLHRILHSCRGLDDLGRAGLPSWRVRHYRVGTGMHPPPREHPGAGAHRERRSIARNGVQWKLE